MKAKRDPPGPAMPKLSAATPANCRCFEVVLVKPVGSHPGLKPKVV